MNQSRSTDAQSKIFVLIITYIAQIMQTFYMYWNRIEIKTIRYKIVLYHSYSQDILVNNNKNIIVHRQIVHCEYYTYMR